MASNAPLTPAADFLPVGECVGDRVNPWVVAVAVVISTFMEVLSTTVVNVSLPQIARSLAASVEEASAALAAYLLANGLILPLAGWLAARFGRRRVVIVGVLVFTTASLFCGLASTLPMLIVCHAIQGAGGGLLQPLSQAVLLETFPPHKRGLAMAFYGLCMVVAPVLGPVLGGWITDQYGWRWIFFINIPAGVISVLMTRLYVFDPPYLRSVRAGFWDWGLGLLAVGVAALEWLLVGGQAEGWFSSNRMRILAAISAAALTAFVLYEMRTRNPLINLRIFRDRTYATGVVLTSVIGFILYGSLFAVPVFLELHLGYSATSAGVAIAPRGLGSVLMMPVVGMLSGRVDPRKLLAGGFLGTAASEYALSRLNAGSSHSAVFWPLLIQGASISFLFVPLTIAAYRHIRREDTGNASGIIGLMRNIGGAAGIACAGAFLFGRQQFYTGMLGARVSLNNPRAAAGPLYQSYSTLWEAVQRQAGIWAFRDAFVGMAILLVAIVPLIFLMRRPAK